MNIATSFADSQRTGHGTAPFQAYLSNIGGTGTFLWSAEGFLPRKTVREACFEPEEGLMSVVVREF
jgi:hypothetical protein